MKMGLAGILFILFLFLKLAGIGDVAAWSWWWVFSPLLAWFFVVGVIVFIGFMAEYRKLK